QTRPSANDRSNFLRLPRLKLEAYPPRFGLFSPIVHLSKNDVTYSTEVECLKPSKMFSKNSK
ncbi:hypothetical protein A2U01_0017478, partial [Trifolium medium]|nr:hypothetical protein [Trifolium medium]